MSSAVVMFPSSLSGEIRPPTAGELLAMKKSGGGLSGEAALAMYRGCWLRDINPGPYRPGPDGKRDVLDLTTVDMQCYHDQIRILAFGSIVEFPFQCPREACAAHAALVPRHYDLAQFPVTPMAPEARACFARGEPYPATVAEREIRIRFMTTSQSEEMRVALGKDPPLSAVMAYPVVSVSGIEPAGIRDWVEQMALTDFEDLNAAVGRAHGTVDREIDVQCDTCGGIVRMDAPFAEWRRPKVTASRR